jgi:hemoglobin-like flavoprotein
MTPEKVRLVQESFAQLVPMKDEVVAAMYERLFELDPGLRPLFRGDMARQRSRLGVALAMVVHGLKNPVAIVPVLEELGRRHNGYGVKPEHYATVGEAMLWALEQALGERFTADVRAAWADAYDLTASTMLKAQQAGPMIRAA